MKFTQSSILMPFIIQFGIMKLVAYVILGFDTEGKKEGVTIQVVDNESLNMGFQCWLNSKSDCKFDKKFYLKREILEKSGTLVKLQNSLRWLK